jgi:hypothetical protein
MRALMLDGEATEKTARVMAYARKHVYHPGDNEPTPGDNPNFVCVLSTYRCVFTYTKSSDTGKLYRNLSISVPSKDFPSPLAVAAIAGLFEFTGAHEGVEARLRDGKWMMHVEEREPHCIVLAEELEEQKAK